MFYTGIPEDLVEILLTYLSYARMKKEDVASSFHASIGRLDDTVCMSFTSAFHYLSELYMNCLNSTVSPSGHSMSMLNMMTAATSSGLKDYLNCSEDEVVEYATFICSIANDARRVRTINILSAVTASNNKAPKLNPHAAQKSLDEEISLQLSTLVESTYKSFDKVAFKAMDHMSCILFYYVFHSAQNLLDKDFHKVWKASVLQNANKNVAGSTPKSRSAKASEEIGFPSNSEQPVDAMDGLQIVPKLMGDLNEYLGDKADFLDAHCFYRLVVICLDKVVVYYLTFLREARNAAQVFTPSSAYQQQIRVDVQALKDCFAGILRDHKSILQFTTREELMARFDILDHCIVLMSAELNSIEFLNTLQVCVDRVKAHHRRNFSTANLIEACLGLRGIKKYTVSGPLGGRSPVRTLSQQTSEMLSATGSAISSTGNHITQKVQQQIAPLSYHAPPVPPPAAKRGGIVRL
jgi:hypothetical protein